MNVSRPDRPQRDAPARIQPKLSAIVAAVNEQATIASVVASLLVSPLVVQVLVVDDGSTDGTLGTVGPFVSPGLLDVVFHDSNRDKVKAKACRLGLRIKEVPISDSPRSIKEGKNIRLRDGIQALWTLWKYRKWEGHWDRDVNEDASHTKSQQALDAVRAR